MARFLVFRLCMSQSSDSHLRGTRLLGSVLLALVIPGLGCGPEHVGTGGTGGTGGSGGTSNSTPSTTSLEPGVYPDGASLCQAMCGFGTCNGDVCTEPPFVDIAVLQAKETDAQGTTTGFSKASACAWTGRSLRYGVALADGPCSIVTQEPVGDGYYGHAPIHIGTLSIESATAGKMDLKLDPECLESPELAFGDLFIGGEIVTATATGGSQVAAFSMESTAPAEVTLTAPATFVRGEPLTITWDPPGPLYLLELGDESTFIHCKADSAGQVTVSGALTATLGPGSSSVRVSAIRFGSEESVTGTGGMPVLFWTSAHASISVARAP